MVKYRKMLKAILLVTVVSGFVPEAFGSGATASYYPSVDPSRADLFSGSFKSRGSYQKHQSKSIEVQAWVREAEEWWTGASRGGDDDTRAGLLRLAEARERLVKCQEKLEQSRVYEAMPEGDRSDRIAFLVRANEKLQSDLIGIHAESMSEAAMQAEIAKMRADLARNENEMNILLERPYKFIAAVEAAQREVAAIEADNKEGANAFKRTFMKRLYTKFKTVYDLRPERGGKPLNTTSSVFLEQLDGKYEGLSIHEQGAIISPLKDMVALLHEVGVDPVVIRGLTGEEVDMLHPQFLLYKLMAALEVPDPRFSAEDLPVPYYKKTPAGYIEQTVVPTGFLDAYGSMLDHIAHIFNVRLQEDVATLRSVLGSGGLVNAEGILGLAENPVPVFLASGSEIWDHEGGESALAGIWQNENRDAQEAFNRILQTYASDFALEGPVLDAAVPPNLLGMAFRLLQASEKDIHSWNHDVTGVSGKKPPRVLRTIEDKVRSNICLYSSTFSSASPVNDDGVWWQIHDDGIIRSDRNQGREVTDLSFSEFAVRYGITPDMSATDEFLDVVQRIVSRHYNLRVLEVMSENVHKMKAPSGAAAHRRTFV